ncbi:MAG: hypothetical protein ACRERC_08500, partial [Candidatus Binatia bacterium]
MLSGGASNSSGSSCTGANNADGSCAFSTQLQVNTGAQVKSRYAWNINADVGAFTTRDTSSSAKHNVSFSATAVGGYRLDVGTTRLGDMNRVDDLLNCSGAADTTGITGASNVALGSGSITLADPGNVATGGGSTSIPFSQSSSAQIFQVSNSVAQSHVLTFTWSGSVRSNSCEAAVRSGADNVSTTGCTACVYPGSPARTRDTDGHFVTVNFTSLCGNSIIEASVSEQCDDGVGNGTAGSCCTTQCQLVTAGTVCRPAAGACDQFEECNGIFGFCPADGKRPNGAGCRAIDGICDVAELCDGVSDNCPADAFEPPSTVCRAGSAGEICDQDETCTGSGADCPADLILPNGTPCRASAGVCDIAESCDGVNKFCPANAFEPNSTECRAAAGVCDVAENCPGNGADCPADALASASTPCRGSAGVCDVVDNCTGVDVDCPADAKSTAPCRGTFGICDVGESCDGINDVCPPDLKVPNGTECRASAGVCDVAEACNGVSSTCPVNAFEPNTTECRGSAGVCDVADSCTGSSAACPADAKSTAECRASAGACDVAEQCDGAGDDCPADAVASNSQVCRSASGVCDAAENCDGSGVDCPTDINQPDSTPCENGLFCDGAETCQSGVCTDGTAPCAIICDEGIDQCLASGCPPAPEPGCRTAQKSLLLIKNKTDDSKDKLIWKWIKGASTSQLDFANPTSTASYALCIYSGTTSALTASVEVPPSPSKWSTVSTKGYKYFDTAATEDGAQKITLKGSSTGKSKALVKGRGANLPDPINATGLTMPVKVQLINHDTAICFEGNYTT